MKMMFTLIAALAALPLTAQDQPTEQQNAPVTCSCPQTQQENNEPKCPEAGMAAAFGFQKGFHMGFEAGFAEAVQLMQASQSGCCKAGKHCKAHKRCNPGAQAPAPRPDAAPATPPPAPQAN